MTVEEAFELLQIEGDKIHTVVQGGPALIGADWTVDDVREVMSEYGVELAGPDATSMGHGLVTVREGNRPVFFATKEC